MNLTLGRVCAVLGLAAIGFSGAVAQDLGGYYGGMAFNGLVTNQTAITQASIARLVMRKAQSGPGRAADVGKKLTSPDTSAAALARLNFTSSPARRRTDYAQFVEKSRKIDPAGAANLAASLASDPIAQMGPELAKVGLSTNNVADAYTIYWVNAWEAAHGINTDSSREQAQAVKQQAEAAILASPEFARASDAQKQEIADALLVQGLLIAASVEQAHGDAARLGQIATAVRQGARATGLDLDAMTLTDHGFVPADRTSATDPAPGTEPRALAADGRSGDHANYGPLAAAGRAGLGAALPIDRAMGRKG